MKKLDRRWKGPLTIWSRGAAELIPARFRRILTVVMPAIYTLLLMFGVTSFIYPVPTFEFLIGTFYGSTWSAIVALSALVSLLGLIFRWRVEIYSAIVLSATLFIYPFYIGYIVYHDPGAQDLSRLAVIYAVALYPIMPAWRAVDIVLEVRKARQRQLYAQYALGVANTNELPVQRRADGGR